MGLKTTNYQKKSGIILSNAYAKIHNLKESRDITTVEVHVNTSREALEKYGADEIKTVIYKTDLNNTGYNVAYKKIKEPLKETVLQDVEVDAPIIDENGKEVIGKVIEKRLVEIEVPNTFTGWEDDIVLGE